MARLRCIRQTKTSYEANSARIPALAQAFAQQRLTEDEAALPARRPLAAKLHLEQQPFRTIDEELPDLGTGDAGNPVWPPGRLNAGSGRLELVAPEGLSLIHI